MPTELDNTMELRRAEQILRRLARGFEPHQDVRLHRQDTCNKPEVIRSLYLAAETLKQACRKQEFARIAKPERMGKSWSANEDTLLNQAFDKRECLRSIAARHQRSSGAILARLVQLGRVKEREEGRDILR